MFITRLKLTNWRNFLNADIRLHEYTYILGPNAAGKSNILDALRFLRDICNPIGGGLQNAVAIRQGFKKIRCLHARQITHVGIEVHFGATIDSTEPEWIYSIAFAPEPAGKRLLLIKQEKVVHNGKELLNRPTPEEEQDPECLTATFLENVQNNQRFRDIATFFANMQYLHLVPQLIKYQYGDLSEGRHDSGTDLHGKRFLETLAKEAQRTRDARLKKITKVLATAVPQFKDLRYIQDEMGRPHLEALYAHHRPNAGWQREDQLSDGTLRLIGMLWSLLSGKGLLMLEEPELSLNDAVVEKIPELIDKLQKTIKRRRQLIITTHSATLLSNKGIDARGVVLLEVSNNGTTARMLNDDEMRPINSGLSVAEVVLPKTRPANIDQMLLDL